MKPGDDEPPEQIVIVCAVQRTPPSISPCSYSAEFKDHEESSAFHVTIATQSEAVTQIREDSFFVAMDTTSHRNNTPLLLLLDGVLSQDEQSTVTALRQIEKLDPSFRCLQTTQQTDPCAAASPDPKDDSPLRSASALEGIVERLLAIRPHLARVASESDGSLPLHFAASIGNIRVAALLLKHHRDAALTHNTKGKIPLHYAAREGRIEMVRFFLRLVPVCAAILTKKGKLALHFASGEGHTEVVRDLLKVYPSGAILPSKKGKVALHFAARWGHIEIAHDLCRIYPACIHTLDYDGSNPLHDATREGQYEMAKFLVERYPPAMCKSNIRGEIPLFAAIRSGNVSLCSFLIRSWPGSGKQVLRTITDPDDVASWDPSVLNLCLRGAVGNFTDLSPEEREYTDSNDDAIKVSIVDGSSSTTSGSAFATGAIGRAMPGELHGSFPYDRYRAHPRAHSANCGDHGASPRVGNLSTTYGSPPRLPPDLDILIPRSKSPILELDDCGKKRSAADGTNGNKRPRRGSIGEDGDEEGGDASDTGCSYRNTLEKHTFYQVHAALECSASVNVLKCVLERYPEQLSLHDDYGRFPLHIAASHCRSEGSVDLVLERIWKRNEGVCSKRDYFGRLPLHLALMARADSRLVEVLLDANPSSGVEQCQCVDERFAHLLPIHVATSHGCDLSSLFMLVRRNPAEVQTWKVAKDSSNSSTSTRKAAR